MIFNDSQGYVCTYCILPLSSLGQFVSVLWLRQKEYILSTEYIPSTYILGCGPERRLPETEKEGSMGCRKLNSIPYTKYIVHTSTTTPFVFVNRLWAAIRASPSGCCLESNIGGSRHV